MSLSLWKGSTKSKTYNFQDRKASEIIRISGQPINYYKYIGPVSTVENDSEYYLPKDNNLVNELSIQDIVFGETRDRKYDTTIYDCRGIFQIADAQDWDMTAFGITLPEQYIIEMHTNDIMKQIGRKPMAGDVLELVSLKDYDSLYTESSPIKKLVVVTEVVRTSSGYGTTLLSHMIRLKTKPLVDSPEYRDILYNNDRVESMDDWMNKLGVSCDGNSGIISSGDPGKGITSTNPLDPSNSLTHNNTNVTSSKEASLQISLELNKMAMEDIRKRSWETRHLFIKNNPMVNKTGLVRNILNQDGIPDDFEGNVIPSGKSFPKNANDGDLFIRTDFNPMVLYIRKQGMWLKNETIFRDEYVPITRILQEFLTNDDTVKLGDKEDQEIQSRQPLSQVGKPKTMNDLVEYKNIEGKGERFK